MDVRPRTSASIAASARCSSLLLALLLLAAAGAAGCGGDTGSEGDGGGAAAGETPKAGGTISIAFQAEPVTLDPAISWDVAGWTVEDSIFNALYRYAPKPGAEGTELIPDLAAEMPEISEDGTTYTIKLRPDAKFAPPVDRAVTAEDVKYSFERMMTVAALPGDVLLRGGGRRIRRRRRQDQDHQRRQGRRPADHPVPAQLARPQLPLRAQHGVLRRHPQGVGRQVGQGREPAPAGHGARSP